MELSLASSCPFEIATRTTRIPPLPTKNEFNMLLFLERMVGTDASVAFFRSVHHALCAAARCRPMIFAPFFVACFASDVDDRTRLAMDGLDWASLPYAPGMPLYVVDYGRSPSDASERLAKQWLSVDRSESIEKRAELIVGSNHVLFRCIAVAHDDVSRRRNSHSRRAR